MKRLQFFLAFGVWFSLLAASQSFAGYYIQVCGVTDRTRSFIASDSDLSRAKAEARSRCQRESRQPGRCTGMACKRVFQPTSVSDLPAPEQARLKKLARRAQAPREANSTPKEQSAPDVYRRCSYDYQCPGGGNGCIAGKCAKAGFTCNQESDCPGPLNGCVAGHCRRAETVCNSESDCLGPMNRCVAGACVIP